MEYVDGSATITNWREMRSEAAFQCAGCKRYVIGGKLHTGMIGPEDLDPDPMMRPAGLHEDSPPHEIAQYLVGDVEYWEPISPVGRTYDDALPVELTGPADEAWRCYSIGGFRAAVLMARAVIEALAKEKGITGGKLYQKIEQLAASQHIRPIIQESAHEARLLGNDMAHGDFATTTVEENDALDVLEIMDDVIDEVLVVPARAQRRKTRREAAKPATD